MDKLPVTLDRMRSFVRVAERASLSAVARELGVGQSTITRHIADLERALGVTLLDRSTRRVMLTPEGARYLEHSRTILRMVDEAADDARNARDHLAGRIRVSCTAALGVRHVASALFAFQDSHPDVDIDLGLSDLRVDLVRDAVDVAIRLGPLADSALLRKAVGNSRRILVASRAYLQEYGYPREPADLMRHRKIRMSNIEGSQTLILHQAEGNSCPVPFEGPLRLDHGLAAREAILQGRGIAPAHVWLIDDLLEAGTVEEVLPGYRPAPVPLSILVTPGRARLKRVRALIDRLADALAALPGIA